MLVVCTKLTFLLKKLKRLSYPRDNLMRKSTQYRVGFLQFQIELHIILLSYKLH